jgi:hypothetical protein
MLESMNGHFIRGVARRRRRIAEASDGVQPSFSACKTRLLTFLAAGIALGFVGMTAMARADTDSYSKITQVNVASNPYTCTFGFGTTSSGFTFDISWVAQDRGEYLLAEASHGSPSSNTEGGILSHATSGDLLVINTDDPAAGASFILPPANDPFAGHRCDANVDFGGVISGPPGHQTDRNSISGPNGVFTVNDTQAWVGDGPSYFTPGQTNHASDYATDPCDSSVRVFDLITKQQIAHINVHGCFRTDEGAFDPVDQVALYANPAELNSVRQVDPHATAVDSSPFITLISTVPDEQPAGEAVEHANSNSAVSQKSFKILTQINFNGSNGTVNANGGIEQAVYSRQTGLFYIAIPARLDSSGNPIDDGYVATVDPRSGNTFGQVTTFPLKAGSCNGGPAGAALGPNHELLLGCGGPPANGEVVVDISNLAVTTAASPTILADGSQGCDEVAYDAGSGHFGGACMNSPSPAFNLLVNDAHTLTFDTALPGAIGAHSIAADSINANFWMPMVGGACGSATQACVAVYAGNDTDAQGD